MGSDGSRLWLEISLILFFLFLKGFFTACETAVTEISDARVKSFADKTGKEKKLYALLSKPGKLLTTFSVHRALSSVIIAFLTALSFQTPLRNLLLSILLDERKSYLPPALMPGTWILSAVLLILLTVLIMVVFCDGLPKKLLSNNESFAVSAAGALRLLMAVLSPLVFLVHAATRFISRLFGADSAREKDVVTEEEILLMVDAGNETGVIEESQREMINNIFEFGDLVVSDVMTHRTDLVAASSDMKISDVVYLATRSGRSRIPVYEDSVDSIIGVIHVKDLLCLIGCEKTEDFSIHDFLRDVLYIPETNKCGDVFKKLTSLREQVAIAVDEYGGTAGIVTIEDLIEAIVGNIQDEYDDEAEEFIQVSDGVYTIDGTAEPETILEKLRLTLPEDHEYDTMGGFIVDLLGYIPDADERPQVFYQGVEFTVLLIEDRRVSKIKAVVPALPESESTQ